MSSFSRPPRRGLYDPRFEHDACGIGFVARLSGAPSHDILAMALTAVGNMAHRGGVGADGKSGDGAGVLTQIPRGFFARELARLGVSYPAEDLAVGMVFLPRDEQQCASARQLFEQGLAEHGLWLLGWRAVPFDDSALGERARAMRPTIEQALVGRRGVALDATSIDGDELHTRTPEEYERALYLARKAIEAAAQEQGIRDFAIPSLSCRTIVYKGLLVAPMLPQFYPDLRDPLYETAIAMFHQRYSTNTFPTWELAQPFRMLSHNGEINTVDGNTTWMRAREAEWRRDEALSSDKVPLAGDQAGRRRAGGAGGSARVADQYEGQRLGQARQRVGTAGAGRARHPPRSDDAGAGSLGARAGYGS
jgi:glutamate synthase (ferredoxin)